MLNELYQVVEANEKLGVIAAQLHPRIKPMGKNKELLVVLIGQDGKPNRVEKMSGEVATTFCFIKHGSEGAGFPGFNLPTPLRGFETNDSIKLGHIKSAIDQFLALKKTKKSEKTILAATIENLFKLSNPREFTKEQCSKFQRSCSELVTELHEIFANPPDELTNFYRLLDVVTAAKLNLSDFAAEVAPLLATQQSEADCLLLFSEILFGVLDWNKRVAEFGTPEYWKEKSKQDENANQPVYLDISQINPAFKRVANSQTSSAIVKLALERNLANKNAEFRKTKITTSKKSHETVEEVWKDAFSGEVTKLASEFPQPRVAELGDLKLFSSNSKETKALFRYGLGGWKVFPTSEILARRFNDELSKLASNANKGKSCYPIPGNKTERDKRTGKTRVIKDLLVAYLDKEPEAHVQLAEMFGGEATDADFQAISQPVIEMLEGKVVKHPDLNVRLIAFCSIDKGRKQISLNRSFRVQEVIQAAKEWQAGARNVPDVSVEFYDKITKQSVSRTHATPCPLEVASIINRVWSSDAKNGFASSFQRALSASDAYDIFIENSPLARRKSEMALSFLVQRMSRVLIVLGAIKTSGEWKRLSDSVRWQSLKSIALFGIFLRQLNQQYSIFMKEPVYQLGQLLALADSLHEQYCKHVRDGKTPTQLIGSSIFNTALEQPVFALARLAERMVPYQAWAKTFKNTDPNVKSGWEKTILRLLRECASRFIEEVDGVFRIRADELPARMTDLDKAKLLLGYLADIQISETEDK